MHKHHRNRHTHAITNPRERTPQGQAPLSRPAALRALGQVVYAARCGDTIKFGHTGDLGARLRQIGADDLLAFVPGTYDEEQELHALLVDHLHHGREWYLPTPDVLAVVNGMRERLGLAPVT